MPIGPALLAVMLNCFNFWAVPLHAFELVQDKPALLKVGKLLYIWIPATPTVAPDCIVVPEDWPVPSALSGSTLTTSPTPPSSLTPMLARSALTVRSLSVSFGRVNESAEEVADVLVPVNETVPTSDEPS